MASKILVVDDEPIIAKVCAYYLKKNGYHALIATNGKEAVRMAFQELPHLILLDLMMPDLDGLTTLRILKRNSKTKDIPVIIVSAKSQQSDVTEAITEGAVDYVVKPFDGATLMKKVKATVNDASKPDAPASPSSKMEPPPQHSGPAILVVEDDHFMGRLIKYRLEQQGYRVVLAKEGGLALQAAQVHPPDLVFLDLMIPGLDGYEVCEALRGDPTTQQVPILVGSSLSGEKDRAKALALGANDYMVKPFKMDELVDRIQALLPMSSENSEG